MILFATIPVVSVLLLRIFFHGLLEEDKETFCSPHNQLESRICLKETVDTLPRCIRASNIVNTTNLCLAVWFLTF